MCAYLGVSLLCGVTALVYYQFSHNVYSPHMTFLFAYPLVAGTVTFIGRISGFFDRTAFNALNSCVAALGTESFVRGILDISGTSSPYLPIYTATGTVMLIFAVARTIYCLIRRYEQRKKA